MEIFSLFIDTFGVLYVASLPDWYSGQIIQLALAIHFDYTFNLRWD